MKRIKLLFTVFPFVPFGGFHYGGISLALAAAGATLIGFKFLPKFKSQPAEPQVFQKLFFYGNPFVFSIEFTSKLYFELQNVNWKAEGEKLLMVMDSVDVAIGWIPVVGDVFDLVDTAAHVIYDYKFNKEQLYMDLAFGVIALIPGMSSGVTHLGYSLLKLKFVAKYGKEAGEVFVKYTVKFRLGLMSAYRVSSITNKVFREVKDLEESVQIAYGLYLVSRRSRRYEEIFNFAIKYSYELKNYDGFIHRVLVQASIETRNYRETKLFTELNELKKLYGEKTAGALVLPLGNIKLLREIGKLDQVLDILNDPVFNRFALVRINADILIMDPERVIKFIKTLSKVTKEVEHAEKILLKRGQFENEVELVGNLDSAAGVYIKTGRMKFSYWAIYHGEKFMDDYMEYLISHEMMHAIGVKTFSGYVYQLQYHYYSLKYGDELASVIVNEKMDLLNAKLWKLVGNEKYIKQYLKSMEVDKLIKLENGKLILKYKETADLKLRSIYAAEYMALKGRRYPTDLGKYDKIVDDLLKSFEKVLK